MATEKKVAELVELSEAEVEKLVANAGGEGWTAGVLEFCKNHKKFAATDLWLATRPDWPDAPAKSIINNIQSKLSRLQSDGQIKYSTDQGTVLVRAIKINNKWYSHK